MPGLGVIDENLIIVKIKLDLTSINSALNDIYALLDGSLPGTAGGDVKTLAGQRDRLKYDGHVVQRSDGDLQVLYCLLDFLMNETNAEVLSRAPYGLLEKSSINTIIQVFQRIVFASLCFSLLNSIDFL